MQSPRKDAIDLPLTISIKEASDAVSMDSEAEMVDTSGSTPALVGRKLNTLECFHWTVNDVVTYLKSIDSLKSEDLEEVCAAFQTHKLDGSQLPILTAEMLEKMDIKAIGVQNKVLASCRALQRQYDGKVFNDPIHGHIELHPLLVRVIDTHQFQRLRNIKQLGGVYYVFPGASHNRFEHSLGVCHIAGEFVEILQRKQPELGITEVDVLCVKMAGLCHDLGHGPFSHLFDKQFIPKACPKAPKWRHEDASVEMLDHLLEVNRLRPEFKRYGLQEKDIDFIKEMIAGPLPKKEDKGKKEEPDEQDEWPYTGRTVEKSFLYEIVANKINNMDVDKWDYFARDCHCLGIPNSFNMMRYMKFARVIPVDGRRQICARDKDVNNLYEMFHARFGLHRIAYQHKTSNAVELMITEALLKANDHLFLPGKDGQKVKMSDAIHDMTAYSRLTDAVLHQIMVSDGQELEESRELLLKIEQRELYKCVGLTEPSPDMKFDEEVIHCQLVESPPAELGALPELKKEDFQVQVVKFDYGMGDKNPIDKMRFYAKRRPNVAIKLDKDQVSKTLPNTFQEKSVRVYCKKLDKDSNKAAWKYFTSWCEKQGQTPKEYDEEGGLTPYGTPLGTTPKKKDGGSDKRHSGDGGKRQSSLVTATKPKKRCLEREYPSS